MSATQQILLTLLLGVYDFSKNLGEMFPNQFAHLVESREGELLGARVASDGQWRFNPVDSVPLRFKQAVLNFEDQRFFIHPGIDPLSLVRAAFQNIAAGEIISGASTITMQCVRMSEGRDRTIINKLIEMIRALSLEFHYSKEEILRAYSSNAPYGGNIIGLRAAALRYYNKKPFELSWAEAAMLAVLPNSPGLINLEKNRDKLKRKRDRLLFRLYLKGIIEEQTYNLSILESIPQSPGQLPDHSPHLTQYFVKNSPNGNIWNTSINFNFQLFLNDLLEQNNRNLAIHNVQNSAVLVINLNDLKVEAYAGNHNVQKSEKSYVDIIRSKRSPGSTLKPFLFYAMLTEGLIYSETLVPDVPYNIENYSPKNFAYNYEGVISAEEALASSLNIPAVHMLEKYGHVRFLHFLQSLGFKSLNKAADYYGLSLILGGGEVSMWNLCFAYAQMALELKANNSTIFVNNNSQQIGDNVLLNDTEIVLKQDKREYPLNPASVYFTFNALSKVKRPGNDQFWTSYNSAQKIAWKTGTSFGERDAWAIGTNGDYLIGVWTGNEDGSTCSGNTGLKVASPILFELFSYLGGGNWFKEPGKFMKETRVCKKSGHPASRICPVTKVIKVPGVNQRLEVCPYHQLLHLDKSESFQVRNFCYNPDEIKKKAWFVLPARKAYYFKQRHLEYKEPPAFLTNCLDYNQKKGLRQIDLVYPSTDGLKISLGRDFNGKGKGLICRAIHQKNNEKIFWQLDNKFVSTTTGPDHRIQIMVDIGKHRLHLIDEAGNIIERTFEVIP